MYSISVNYANMLLDEISLEGLDGITLQALWKRIEERCDCSVSETLKKKFWNIIVNLKDIEFYLLPEPRADLIIFKRFTKSNGKYYVNDVQEENFLLQSAIYPLHPINNDYGSCLHYNKRVNITSDAKSLSLESAVENWGNKMVMVATLQARWQALAPGSPPVFESLNKPQYCILESIGRSRYNGETTWKMTTVKGEPEDAKTLFYHRKMLISHNLVVKKQIHTKSTSSVNTIILHLPRFDVPFVSKGKTIISRLVDFINATPNKMISLAGLKDFLDGTIYEANGIKKFLKLADVTKVVTISTVRYSDLHPDAPPEKCISKTYKTPIIAKVIKLVTPGQTSGIQEEPEDQDTSIDEDVVGHCYVGEQLLHQAYNCVCEAGSKGITRLELGKKLGIDILTARSLLRRLQFRDNLKVLLVEDRRQKREIFLCPDFLCQRKKEFENEKKKMADLPKPITVDSNNTHTNAKMLISEKKSLKNLQLSNLILEQVRYRHIIHEIFNLNKYCQREQLARGVNTGIVDRKTILRIVKDLDQQGLVRFHKIKLEPKYNSKILAFICEPHIQMDHPFIQSVIEQAKMQVNTVHKGKKEFSKQRSTPGSLLPKFTCKNGNKFLKTCALHRFLYYTIYENKGKIVEDKEYLLNNVNGLKDLPDTDISPIYEDAPNDFLFVPPIHKYTGWPDGWVMLADIFLSMPLHIFTTIVSIQLFPLLDKYLKHPIKRQILLKNAPFEIQNTILWKKTHIFPVIEKLCFLGLLKFGQRVMKEKFRVFVYLNRVSSLLDTTSSGPSYYHVEEKEYPEEFFTFDSLDSVERYWSRLKYISLHTIMGIATSMMGKEITILSPERKLSEYLRSYSATEAIELDVGSVPGDRRGSGGADSSLFTHLKRSWGISEFNVKPISVPRNMPPTKILQLRKLIKKKAKLTKSCEMFLSTNNIVSKAKGKVIKRTVKPRKRKISESVKQIQDNIGVKRVLQRTYWSCKEDRIILLSHIACEIMGSQKPFIHVQDVLCKVTGITDKNMAACRRRLLFMKKKKSLFRNIEIQLSEIKQNSIITKKYSQIYKRNFVKENTKEYPNFMKEMQIHFIELIHYLHKILFNKVISNKFMIIPNNLKDLETQYIITPSVTANNEHYTEPTTIGDITQMKAHSVIHITLCSDPKSNLSSKKHALGIFLQFDEELLRSTITKINSTGMAVKIKKIKTKKQPSAQLSSTYSMSHSYIYNLGSITPYTIFSELYNDYKNIIQNNLTTIDPISIDSGMMVIITDLQSLLALDMKITLPENILIPNPSLACNLDGDNEDNDSSEVSQFGSRIPDLAQSVDGFPHHSQDALCINTCHIDTTLKYDINKFFNISTQDVNNLLKKWINDATFEYDKSKICDIADLFDSQFHQQLANEIHTFIESKEITGAFCTDIKSEFHMYDKHLMHNILVKLKDAKKVFRIGVKKLRWVSEKYFHYWLTKIKQPRSMLSSNIYKRKFKDLEETIAKKIKLESELDITKSSIDETTVSEPQLDQSVSQSIEDNSDIEQECEASTSKQTCEKHLDDEEEDVLHEVYLCARVWMKLDGTLNFRTLWRWMGAILCYLTSHPTLAFEKLCKKFVYMFPFHLYLLLEMLGDMQCMKLYTIHKKKMTLWDDECMHTLEETTTLDEFSDIQISILEGSLLKFALHRGIAIDIKKSQDSSFSFDEVSQTVTSIQHVKNVTVDDSK